MTNPFHTMIDADSARYRRERDLPKILAVWPQEIENHSVAGTEHVIRRIENVAVVMHELALANHYSYDINRHIAVLSALRAERAALAQLQNAQMLARMVSEAAA